MMVMMMMMMMIMMMMDDDALVFYIPKSSLFKSYWDDRRVMTKSSVQWSAVQSWVELHLELDSSLRTQSWECLPIGHTDASLHAWAKNVDPDLTAPRSIKKKHSTLFMIACLNLSKGGSIYYGIIFWPPLSLLPLKKSNRTTFDEYASLEFSW